ncbi:hypothetical protein KHA80_08070 [Anaerobacillus sp. HL2]|nr:hypothetical protein KHA80_08070 [Anaerobacillus sp. HL2]
MVVVSQTDGLKDLTISEKTKKFVLDCLHKGIAVEDIGYEFEKTKLDDNPKKKEEWSNFIHQNILFNICLIIY